MNPRTRRLLTLLADDTVASALNACRSGDKTLSELEATTGAKRTKLHEKLTLLVAYGLLEPAPSRRGGGRPAEAWRTSNDRVRDAFERQADEFLQELYRSTARDLDGPSAMAERLRLAQPEG